MAASSGGRLVRGWWTLVIMPRCHRTMRLIMIRAMGLVSRQGGGVVV